MPTDTRALAQNYTGGSAEPPGDYPVTARDIRGQGVDVYCIAAPHYPEFRFEWHTRSRNVYFIRLGEEPWIGELLANQVEDHGQAWTVVHIWLRGYREGKTPRLRVLAE
jgi:hypothetical protein